MRVAGIVGRSGSGKTTLIERLLPLLLGRGLSVSTVKRTHHDVDLDPPGKDSWRHRRAGAQEVLLASARRWALLRETPDAPDPLPALLGRMAPVDLVLVEGFGATPGPRLEVAQRALAGRPGREPLFGRDPGILALASDAPIPGWTGRWFHRDDPASIADWIVSAAAPESGRT